jgi:hypothetical protein
MSRKIGETWGIPRLETTAKTLPGFARRTAGGGCPHISQDPHPAAKGATRVGHPLRFEFARK